MVPPIFLDLWFCPPPRFHSTCHGSIQTYTNSSDINWLDANLTWLASYWINSFVSLQAMLILKKSFGIVHSFTNSCHVCIVAPPDKLMFLHLCITMHAHVLLALLWVVSGSQLNTKRLAWNGYGGEPLTVILHEGHLVLKREEYSALSCLTHCSQYTVSNFDIVIVQVYFKINSNLGYYVQQCHHHFSCLKWCHTIASYL